MEALIVTRSEAGQKLLNFLSRRVDAGSGELHKWIRSGQVRVNGGRAQAFDRVDQGDAVRVPPFAALREVENTRPTPPAGSRTAGRTPGEADRPELRVVYEDDDLLVLNKPAGLPTQGGTGHADSVAARLARLYAAADFVPAPAHRLDKDTSGLLAAGKTYAALRGLTDALAGRGGVPPVKEYLAWVWGAWPHPGVMELRDRLTKDEERRRMIAAPQTGLRPDGPAGQKGREARCLVAPANACAGRAVDGAPVSLLLIRLLTGRTHQIRVQLAARGFPLVGDAKYGHPSQDAHLRTGGLKLHAFRLILPAPAARTVEIPPDWPSPWNVATPPPFPAFRLP